LFTLVRSKSSLSMNKRDTAWTFKSVLAGILLFWFTQWPEMTTFVLKLWDIIFRNQIFFFRLKMTKTVKNILIQLIQTSLIFGSKNASYFLDEFSKI